MEIAFSLKDLLEEHKTISKPDQSEAEYQKKAGEYLKARKEKYMEIVKAEKELAGLSSTLSEDEKALEKLRGELKELEKNIGSSKQALESTVHFIQIFIG